MNRSAHPLAVEDRDQIRQLLDRFDVVMLTTRAPSGALRAQPMMLADVEGIEQLWLMAPVDDDAVRDVEDIPDVGLTARSDESYLALSGVASVHVDPAQARRLWQPAFGEWMAGPESPALRLLRVVIREASYWVPATENRSWTRFSFTHLVDAMAPVRGRAVDHGRVTFGG